MEYISNMSLLKNFAKKFGAGFQENQFQGYKVIKLENNSIAVRQESDRNRNVQTEGKLENIGARLETSPRKSPKPVVLKLDHMTPQCTHQLYKRPEENDRKLGGHCNF
jgi:hypothetical protein